MAEKKLPKRKNALGRGLGALLDDSDSVAHIEKSSGSSKLDEIPLDQIETNPYQPRTDFEQESLKEMADSIKIHGIIQPITVRKLNARRYQLISGERRYQASKIAGKESIIAYIRTANDQQMLEMALIENIQRENLNAIEIALSYQRLMNECDLKQEQLGDRVGKKRSTINNYLRLLRLPPDIQIALRDNKISMGHARALINIESIDTQLAIFKKAVAEDLSVRKVEELARIANLGKEEAKPKAKTAPTQENAEITSLKKRLSSHFGTKVEIKTDGKNKGEIKIPFVSVDDLNRILDLLDAQ